MLRVHHYYPFGSGNVGDHLVAHALRIALTRHFGPCRFVDMPVNDRYDGPRAIGIRGDNLDQSNREADLVVVGGSNLLEPRKPRRLSGVGPRLGRWGVFTDVESIANLRTPTLAFGMGTGSDFGKSIRRYVEPTIAEIGQLAKVAFGFAVRDEPTRSRLSEIGVRAECTGCPVTFLTDRPVRAADYDQPLIVSFPSTGLANHWRGRAFLKQTAGYLRWLKLLGEKFVIALHDDRDRAAVATWLPTDTQVFFSKDIPEIIDRFERSRGVIGFRLHAALLGLGLGKPIVPVGVDWRGRGFIETFGLEKFSIQAGGALQFAKLRQATLRLLEGSPEILDTLAARKLEFRQRQERFLADAAANFNRRKQAA